MKKPQPGRILGRKLAKDLTRDQLESVAGGTICSCAGEYDDSDFSY